MVVAALCMGLSLRWRDKETEGYFPVFNSWADLSKNGATQD